MIESKIVNEWTAQARMAGEIEGKVDALLRVLRRKFTSVPADVDAAIRACKDSDRLDTWVDAAVTAASLADFRREAGL